MIWKTIFKRLLEPLKNEVGAVTIDHYEKLMLLVGVSTANKFIDLDDVTADTFKIQLHTSAYTFAQTHIQKSELSNELATNFGYTQGDEPLASVTWLDSGGTTTWDAANITWTASGGSIGPARQAVIYDETTSAASFTDALMMNIDFGADETAADTATFNINWNASGIFTVA